MQKFGSTSKQASTRLNFASKSSKGKILQAVKNFNGPFITPSCALREMPQLPQLAHKVPIMQARAKMKLYVTNTQPLPEKFLGFHWAY